jgi:hypothetical protein
MADQDQHRLQLFEHEVLRMCALPGVFSVGRLHTE